MRALRLVALTPIRLPSRAVLLVCWLSGVAVSVGCGGLGKLRSEDIVGAIESAQASIADARERDLATSAKPALSRAEYKLVEARNAYRARRGVDALRAAQEAEFEARQAMALDDQADAFQRLLAQEVEQYQKLSEQLQAAQNEAEAQRQQALSVQTELNLLTSRLQTLEANYQRELAEALASKQEAEEKVRALENDLEANRQRAERLSELYNTAKAQQQSAERQVREIQQRIKEAEAAVSAAQQLAARRAQEAQAVKQQAKELASAYSRRMETMQRESEKEAALSKARASAQKEHPPSQLGGVEIDQARSLVRSWKQAWDTGDLASHLNAYAANAQGERVNVIKGKEVRRALTRSGLFAEIRSLDRPRWQEVGTPTVGAEGNHVVAQIAYRKKNGSSDAYNFLIRRSWWQKSGSDWRIVKERLQFYSDVPNFSTR